jgi:alpha-galactosidase
VPVKGAKRLVLAVDDGGNDANYDHAAWIEPTLTGPKGTLKLTDLKWTSATTGWGELQAGRSAAGAPLTWKGEPAWGIGAHAVSAIAYDLPEGYDRFSARGIITPVDGGTASVRFLVLVDPKETRVPARSTVAVSFADIGINGKAKVRDLWKREDLGEFSDRLSTDLPLKGTRLYRISPSQ